ncbi:MAG: hypothetical protein Q4F05_19120 [bacterium]|nr:hypothetical protein [bacterium]
MFQEKLKVSHKKTLKLTNVLYKELINPNLEKIEKEVELMENYIKAKGANPIGPLIQRVDTVITDENVINIQITLYRQCNKYIRSVDFDYKFQSIYSVDNCLYVRFFDSEEYLSIAYDKLKVIAYEEDIKLKDGNYTVYVDRKENKIIADVFMERAD